MLRCGASLLPVLIAGAVALEVAPTGAHKPITSPYTYNEHVYPVLRDRCGRCHAPGGVAPMSLLTHEDTVPWGESIRLELLAGHMPPWRLDSSPSRFHNVHPLTAREMDVVLTWATGGTPLGDPAAGPGVPTAQRSWSLGPPDLHLPLPREHVVAANIQEEVVEFVVPTATAERKWIRAVDLLPGTASVVRSATIHLRPTAASPDDREHVLALWLPGDTPVLVRGGAFELPEAAELVVRIRYKKNWQFERQEVRDRSTIGLYLSSEPSPPVRAIRLDSARPPQALGRVVLTHTLEEDVNVLAIYPDDEVADAGVVMSAVEPGGTRRELIAFRPRRGWARRFWFRDPPSLSRGTTLEASITFDDDPALAVVGPAPVAQPRANPSKARLTLNVVAPPN
jgi:hypothetical protein